MKTYLIPIALLLCTLCSSTIICNAQNTINAFKQGSVWTETHKSMYEPEPEIETYTIEEVQLEQQPTARYHLDGRRASSSAHGICIENHRVVIR